MTYTQYFYAKCGSNQIRCNGGKNDQPKYQCTACCYQSVFTPAAARKAAQYVQVDTLLVERNAQRRIVRATGVARMTIAKRLKKCGSALASVVPAAPEKGLKEALGGPGTR